MAGDQLVLAGSSSDAPSGELCGERCSFHGLDTVMSANDVLGMEMTATRV